MTQAHRIHALPIQLANQIAAGEVIERPASVVKELVENSIDAGATQIDIQIEGAGSQLIRVTDNGEGIHHDDLALALTRHATSKLHTSEQLSQIGSLGFRGEALPSITSVSRFKLVSRQPDTECGWQVTGETETPSPAAHPVGTTVEVRDLFFNLPARRRFLRSNKTEQQHIITSIQRLALSRFDVGFNCHFSSKNKLKLPAINDHQNADKRIARICGKHFIEHAVHIHQVYDDIVLSGWLGTPDANRSQTDVQYFFINGRVIRDRVINHAIRQAYGSLIPDGRQPAYVLYLTLPLDRVDVNVHPTKHEVRFRDARLIHGLINRGVEEALALPVAENEIPANKLHTKPARVAEPSNSYAKPSLKKAESAVIPALFDKPGTVNQDVNLVQILHARFALITQADEQWLIDLALADKQLRQKQYKQALQDGTVTSRPILVPIRIKIDAAQSELLNNHQDLIEQLGFSLLVESDHVVVKSIPSILASADINVLTTRLLLALEEGECEMDELIMKLLEELPQQSGFTQQQASSIIQQIGPNIIKNSCYCRKLDQLTLSSLFSS